MKEQLSLLEKQNETDTNTGLIAVLKKYIGIPYVISVKGMNQSADIVSISNFPTLLTKKIKPRKPQKKKHIHKWEFTQKEAHCECGKVLKKTIIPDGVKMNLKS